ncbi:hypothetical protein FE257_006787 [Aspergillus nanangensis]|uniref:Alpha/beta hydrolase fold-3 domain-containing protein n=1 Tax=Aspergillus nanangensis TaxID=2582783 RepID=A0AAD4GUQ5_ASPNN|nr:hypothetical protein FE257_006787 [Aspergillus nanangensis]
MADFSAFTGPSAEWLALEPTLPPVPDLSIEDLKKAANKLREEAAAQALITEGLTTQVTIQDHTIPTRDNQTLQASTYRPAGIPPSSSHRLPIYIHLHGGGFLFGTLRSEDAICARIVATSSSSSHPVIVLNINYRHTPEHTYPTAWNDVEDAFHWLHDHVDSLGGDPARVVVGGISAGAWLTASLVLAQHRGEDEALAARPRIVGQVLMIPCVVWGEKNHARQVERLRDPSVDSYVQNAGAPILPVERARLFTGLLKVEDHGQGRELELEEDRRLSPGVATGEEVRGLPPAVFGVAGRDPLRDEGLLFARLLSENGVPTDVNVFSGLPHGFRRYGDKLSESKRWDAVVFRGIQWALGGPAANTFEIKLE